jgi:hypothetical protein
VRGLPKTIDSGYTLILTFSLKGEGMAKCANRGGYWPSPGLSPTRERLETRLSVAKDIGKKYVVDLSSTLRYFSPKGIKELSGPDGY